MKRSGWACWIFSALLAAAAAPGAVRALPEGSLLQNGLRLAQVEYIAGYALPQPPSPALRGEPRPLPLTLSRPVFPGTARWVRATFALGAVPSQELGIFLPYASPQAAVYLNGAYLGESQGFGSADGDAWNQPLYIRIPAVLLRPSGNSLLIELYSPSEGPLELGPLWVGGNSMLEPTYQWRLWLQVTGVEVVTLLVGLIGALAAALWLRRRSESLFGLFALSCGIWMVRNTQFFVVRTHSLFYFALITDAALFWLVAVLFRLSFRILERRFPRIEAGLFCYALLATVAMYLGGHSHKWIVTAIAYAGLLPVAAVFQVYLTAATVRVPSVLRALLWLAAIVTSLSGAYDLALMLEWVPWPASYLMPYSSLFYSVTVGWALVDRFVRTHNQYEQLNVALDARVRERESALRAQYAEAADLERTRAVAAERERILRDVHDGLGLHLIAARQLVEQGHHSREEIASVLSDAMDELRIAIDSMKPTADDLLVMLGDLRYRLEPRLNAAGIELHWDVDSGGPLAQLGPSAITHITHIVKEVCANAIKHSRATEMRLSVRCRDPQTLAITITDNGRGYDVAAVREGVGTASMRKRARDIGAGLEIESRPGHTRVALSVSVRR